jgi:hypothetical protein
MSLKNAALVALIGMLLLSILVVVDFISNISHVLGGLVPAVILFRSLIYTVSSLCVTAFFFVFHKAAPL